MIRKYIPDASTHDNAYRVRLLLGTTGPHGDRASHNRYS